MLYHRRTSGFATAHLLDEGSRHLNIVIEGRGEGGLLVVWAHCRVNNSVLCCQGCHMYAKRREGAQLNFRVDLPLGFQGPSALLPFPRLSPSVFQHLSSVAPKYVENYQRLSTSFNHFKEIPLGFNSSSCLKDVERRWQFSSIFRRPLERY